MTGLELAAELRRARKGGRPRVIILTTFARPGYLRRALEAGASGYLLKDAPAEKLADAIRGVHEGCASSIRSWRRMPGARAIR